MQTRQLVDTGRLQQLDNIPCIGMAGEETTLRWALDHASFGPMCQTSWHLLDPKDCPLPDTINKKLASQITPELREAFLSVPYEVTIGVLSGRSLLPKEMALESFSYLHHLWNPHSDKGKRGQEIVAKAVKEIGLGNVLPLEAMLAQIQATRMVTELAPDNEKLNGQYNLPMALHVVVGRVATVFGWLAQGDDIGFESLKKGQYINPYYISRFNNTQLIANISKAPLAEQSLIYANVLMEQRQPIVEALSHLYHFHSMENYQSSWGRKVIEKALEIIQEKVIPLEELIEKSPENKWRSSINNTAMSGRGGSVVPGGRVS